MNEFVDDGVAYNWRSHMGSIDDSEPAVDFMQVVCYLYLAAQAVGEDEPSRWSAYVGWARDCWQWRVDEVVAEVGVWREGRCIGPPTSDRRAAPRTAANEDKRHTCQHQELRELHKKRTDRPQRPHQMSKS